MAVRDVSVFILYTSTGHILLQHRTDDAFRLPGYWAFFGGGIEQGENPTEALKREIREELSCLVQNPKFLLAQKVRDFQGVDLKYRCQFFPRLQEPPHCDRVLVTGGTESATIPPRSFPIVISAFSLSSCQEHPYFQCGIETTRLHS